MTKAWITRTFFLSGICNTMTCKLICLVLYIVPNRRLAFAFFGR